MRRGSIFTFVEEGRRNSSHMAQLEITNNRTGCSVDNIKYNREGGCFVSNKKFAICFFLFIVCISGAGFVGHRFAFSPKPKVHDPLDLLALEESEENNISDSKFILSGLIYPTRYQIILTPIFLMNTVIKIKGHIVIEFRQNSGKNLDKLILNAQNINPLSYRLTRVTHSKNEKKRELEEENNHQITTLSEEVTISSVDDTITIGYTDKEEATSLDYDSTTSDDNLLQLNETEKTLLNEKDNHNRDKNVDLNHETLKDIGIGNYEINEASKVHVIHSLTPIEPGNYSLEIEYEVLFNDSGLFETNFTGDDQRRWLMATQLKPINARRLFPVFDDMKFKARFSLSVSRPKEMRVLSNMPLKISNDSSNGQVIDIFEETPLISPHNLAFIEGNIQTIVKTNYGDGDNSSTITFWGDASKSSQITYLSDKIDVVLDKFVNLFSINYPMKKMDLIGHPMTLDGTGSPGLISIKEQLFYLQEESSPMVLKIQAVKNLIHQVGRQWLGGVINTQNWTDTWLLEGSLIYFSHAFLKEIDPAFDTSGSFESDVQWKMMDRDAYSVSRSLQRKVHASRLDNFDNQHYSKGACLIRMLHGLLNDTAFRSGYQKLASRWIYGNGNLKSFWEAMSEDTENQTENLNLIDIMNTWIYQNGYPVVSVNRDNETGTIIVNQAWFTFDNISEQSEKLWYIPLTFTNSSDDWLSPTKHLMTKNEISLKNIIVDNWIVFNINGEGYYRVNYDINNWMSLAEALNEKPEQFPPATRASLIDDVLSLAQGGLTSYKMAFKLINYMRTKEKHYAPWAALTSHLLKLKFALYDTDIYSDFQIFTRQFLSVIYNETELTNDEGSQLAVVIKNLACNFEHPQCIDWARKLFSITKTSGFQSLPLHTREIFYCTVARVGGEDDWQYFLQKAINATDKEEKNRLLSSLACFQVPWILQKILKMTLEENLFSEEESRLILHSFSRNPEAAFAVQRFIERSWPEITNRYQKSYFMMKEFILAMSKSLMTKQDLVMFQEFRDNNIKSLKAVGYEVVLAEVESSSWEQWRNNSLPEIEKMIKLFLVA